MSFAFIENINSWDRLRTAEFYTNSMNLVYSPSVHKSGARYTWDVTGEIPEVSWAQTAGCHAEHSANGTIHSEAPR